jgi:ribosomal protein S18 acetylase RimI-like enzyme
MSISIRPARDAEVEPARAVLSAAYGQYESAFPAENWAPYLADVLDIEKRAAVSELLVFERDGRVVGCVSYYPPGSRMSYPSEDFSTPWPADWAAIRLLAVDPVARKGGVGRALTEACVERASAVGAPAIGLHTTKEMDIARAMYERMGFERAPEYDFRPGPAILVEAYQRILA